MHGLASLLLGTLLLAATPGYAAPRMNPEEELSRALAGRVAGEPVSCINLRNIRSSRIIRDTAILYEAGSVVYLNRPTSGRESLDDWNILVTRTHSSQLCSIDVVTLIDRGSNFYSGSIFLGEFVPYRRVRAASRD